MSLVEVVPQEGLYRFIDQGPVARSLVSANRWLRGIKMYRFPWYLTLVSTNHASSNPGQINQSIQRITQLFPVILIRWILIYPLDSVIQLLKNRGLVINWDLC